MGRTTSHTRKPTAYGGLLVSTHPVRPAYWVLLGVGGGPGGPPVGPCNTALSSNLGTPAYVTATAAAGRAFVLVTVLQVVRTGRLFTPTCTLTQVIGKLRQ